MKIKTKLQTAVSHQSAAGEIEKSVTLITEIKILRSGGWGRVLLCSIRGGGWINTAWNGPQIIRSFLAFWKRMKTTICDMTVWNIKITEKPLQVLIIARLSLINGTQVSVWSFLFVKMPICDVTRDQLKFSKQNRVFRLEIGFNPILSTSYF